MMQVVRTTGGMREMSAAWRADGRRIGLVPTMGYFHEGHLSLMRAAARECDLIVTSLFVNPTQFGPAEDLAKYPRDFQRDANLAEAEDVDVLFAPEPEEIYPAGYRTNVRVEGWSDRMCGVTRPIHFQGVTTVCCKLFNIVRPHRAYFGWKDAQQLLIVRRMAADLNMGVEVVGLPIVRETDGLAMSSRNVYLEPEDRRQATALKRSLDEAKRLYDAGERETSVIRAAMERLIVNEAPAGRIDYITAVDTNSLEDAERMGPNTLLALAVFFGKTRLIDNMVF